MSVVLVGQPRSGTSMMMRMLNFGGVDIEYKHEVANKEMFGKNMNLMERMSLFRNIHGFFEITTPSYTKCFKCLKIESLKKVPKDWKVVYIERDLESIKSSWKRIIENIDFLDKYISNINEIKKELEGRQVLSLNYDEVHKNPRKTAEQLKNFLGEFFDVERSIKAVDQSLYVDRNKEKGDK